MRFLWPSLLAVLVLIASFSAPMPAVANDSRNENPFKSAKVGDFAIYNVSQRNGGKEVLGKATWTVTAKTDKEATIELSGLGLNAKEVQSQTIDLTKPLNLIELIGGKDAPRGIKFENDKDGVERIKVIKKEYDSTWTSFNAKLEGYGVAASVKIWMVSGLSIPIAKIKTTMFAPDGGVYELTLELKETGSKK